MRIGIDARTLSNRLTGIGRYTYELSKAILEIPGNHLSLYSPSVICEDVSEGLKTASIKTGVSCNRLTKMIWSQTKLPLLANRDCIDLFWGPTHRLPRFLNKSIPRVLTIHDLVWLEAPQTMRPLSLFAEKRLMPEAINLADLLMVDSQSTAEGIAKFFPQHIQKIRVVKLGVSELITSPFTVSLSEFAITKPYFLFVGTIEPRKNLERLLHAFAILPKFYQDQFSIVIVGGQGWGAIDLQAIIKKHSLQKSVKILGYVTDEQLASLYAQARFLAMPSLYEGFGLPLVEAMQYGTPLLTSNAGSMPEVAGDAAVLVNPLSIQSISKALERMLSDDVLLSTLRNNASMQVKSFTWKKCASETMSVFQDAIALRNSQATN